eukprot:GHVS01044886.1.p1 GENE.GHVS01044886.1~~GHVS01044886.1.p1  ORF type:complete len:1478 (-),score=342.22 GHVS01044886.1:210-4643(-)
MQSPSLLSLSYRACSLAEEPSSQPQTEHTEQEIPSAAAAFIAAAHRGITTTPPMSVAPFPPSRHRVPRSSNHPAAPNIYHQTTFSSPSSSAVPLSATSSSQLSQAASSCLTNSGEVDGGGRPRQQRRQEEEREGQPDSSSVHSSSHYVFIDSSNATPLQWVPNNTGQTTGTFLRMVPLTPQIFRGLSSSQPFSESHHQQFAVAQSEDAPPPRGGGRVEEVQPPPPDSEGLVEVGGVRACHFRRPAAGDASRQEGRSVALPTVSSTQSVRSWKGSTAAASTLPSARTNNTAGVVGGSFLMQQSPSRSPQLSNRMEAAVATSSFSRSSAAAKCRIAEAAAKCRIAAEAEEHNRPLTEGSATRRRPARAAHFRRPSFFDLPECSPSSTSRTSGERALPAKRTQGTRADMNFAPSCYVMNMEPAPQPPKESCAAASAAEREEGGCVEVDVPPPVIPATAELTREPARSLCTLTAEFWRLLEEWCPELHDQLRLVIFYESKHEKNVSENGDGVQKKREREEVTNVEVSSPAKRLRRSTAAVEELSRSVEDDGEGGAASIVGSDGVSTASGASPGGSSLSSFSSFSSQLDSSTSSSPRASDPSAMTCLVRELKKRAAGAALSEIGGGGGGMLQQTEEEETSAKLESCASCPGNSANEKATICGDGGFSSKRALRGGGGVVVKLLLELEEQTMPPQELTPVLSNNVELEKRGEGGGEVKTQERSGDSTLLGLSKVADRLKALVEVYSCFCSDKNSATVECAERNLEQGRSPITRSLIGGGHREGHRGIIDLLFHGLMAAQECFTAEAAFLSQIPSEALACTTTIPLETTFDQLEKEEDENSCAGDVGHAPDCRQQFVVGPSACCATTSSVYYSAAGGTVTLRGALQAACVQPTGPEAADVCEELVERSPQQDVQAVVEKAATSCRLVVVDEPQALAMEFWQFAHQCCPELYNKLSQLFPGNEKKETKTSRETDGDIEVEDLPDDMIRQKKHAADDSGETPPPTLAGRTKQGSVLGSSEAQMPDAYSQSVEAVGMLSSDKSAAGASRCVAERELVITTERVAAAVLWLVGILRNRLNELLFISGGVSPPPPSKYLRSCLPEDDYSDCSHLSNHPEQEGVKYVCNSGWDGQFEDTLYLGGDCWQEDDRLKESVILHQLLSALEERCSIQLEAKVLSETAVCGGAPALSGSRQVGQGEDGVSGVVGVVADTMIDLANLYADCAVLDEETSAEEPTHLGRLPQAAARPTDGAIDWASTRRLEATFGHLMKSAFQARMAADVNWRGPPQKSSGDDRLSVLCCDERKELYRDNKSSSIQRDEEYPAFAAREETATGSGTAPAENEESLGTPRLESEWIRYSQSYDGSSADVDKPGWLLCDAAGRTTHLEWLKSLDERLEELANRLFLRGEEAKDAMAFPTECFAVIHRQALRLMFGDDYFQYVSFLACSNPSDGLPLLRRRVERAVELVQTKVGRNGLKRADRRHSHGTK